MQSFKKFIAEADTHCSDKCCGADVKAEDCKCPPDCPHCDCNAVKESFDPKHPKVVAARKAHKAGTYNGNMDKNGNAIVHIDGKPHTVTKGDPAAKTEAYEEPQGQAKRMSSPLQKIRQDKEKADRDKDGKLKKEDAQLDEISMDTLSSYKDKAKYSRDKAQNSAAANYMRGTKGSGGKNDPDIKTMQKRDRGKELYYSNITNKLRKQLADKKAKLKKEEVNEGIPVKRKEYDPYASSTKKAIQHAKSQQAISKARNDAVTTSREVDNKREYDKKQDAKAKALADRNKAKSDAIRKEDAQLDELSPATLKSYKKKALKQYKQSANKKMPGGGDYGSATKAAQDKHQKRFDKRHKGIGSEIKRTTDKDIHLKDPKGLVRKDPKSNSMTGKPAPYKNRAESLDEDTINSITAKYINENNITMAELEAMSPEQLDEIIGKAIGGLAKAAIKTGAAAIRGGQAAKKRVSTAGRADAAEKKADAAEKKQADRQRISDAKARVKAAKDSLRRKTQAASQT